VPTEDNIAITKAFSADWKEHTTPALFGINTIEQPSNYTAYPVSQACSRELTRSETLRLFDLYYDYDHDGRRADVPVQAVLSGYTGDGFAISTSVTDFAALIPLDERNESPIGTPELWAGVKAAGWMPFLLFPQGEMSDQELLQLIEVVDAFNLLVPYMDPWAMGDEYDNRTMTRRERIRFEEILAYCEQEENYRPVGTLSDTPGDGLYIKGYNGGGETVYHYPENREMTEEELLQIAYEIVQRRQRSQAEWDYAANTMREMIAGGDAEKPVGTAEQAVQDLLAIMGDVNVFLEVEPRYDADAGVWDVSFIENTPMGAPYYYYSFKINPRTGDLQEARQSYYGFAYLRSYLIGNMIMGVLPHVEVADAFDPHWAEMAGRHLQQVRFYSGAEVMNIRSDDSMNGFCVKIDYADGQKAFVFIDPVTDALDGYQMITDAEITKYWGSYVW
jgi:hypothetical protein